ncbi:MAG: hypothetical protein GWN64_07855 [Candidatus Thorarchaeota archaeon]|nr:hypothetical protein [Candidatus Thorarchaeota archaeon]
MITTIKQVNNIHLTPIKRQMVKGRIKHFWRKRTFGIENLKKNFSCNVLTVYRALRELRDEGYYFCLGGGRVAVYKLG